jgi:hypothetical protein
MKSKIVDDDVTANGDIAVDDDASMNGDIDGEDSSLSGSIVSARNIDDVEEGVQAAETVNIRRKSRRRKVKAKAFNATANLRGFKGAKKSKSKVTPTKTLKSPIGLKKNVLKVMAAQTFLKKPAPETATGFKGSSKTSKKNRSTKKGVVGMKSKIVDDDVTANGDIAVDDDASMNGDIDGEDSSLSGSIGDAEGDGTGKFKETLNRSRSVRVDTDCGNEDSATPHLRKDMMKKKKKKMTKKRKGATTCKAIESGPTIAASAVDPKKGQIGGGSPASAESDGDSVLNIEEKTRAIMRRCSLVIDRNAPVPDSADSRSDMASVEVEEDEDEGT